MSIFRKYDIKKTVAVHQWNEKTGKREKVNILIQIDSEALARQLGEKAIKSRNKQSVLLYGVVMVTPDPG